MKTIKIGNKAELSLQTIIIFIIALIVFLVVITYFGTGYVENIGQIENTGNSILDNAEKGFE